MCLVPIHLDLASLLKVIQRAVELDASAPAQSKPGHDLMVRGAELATHVTDLLFDVFGKRCHRYLRVVNREQDYPATRTDHLRGTKNAEELILGGCFLNAVGLETTSPRRHKKQSREELQIVVLAYS